MLLRKYQISDTLRLYATLSALQLLCFSKNPDDGGGGWNYSEHNRTDLLLEESENVFFDDLLFPAEQSIIFNPNEDMNVRKILEESTFQSWQSQLARKSLVEDLIRFDRRRNDNDNNIDNGKITLYPLDIQNETTHQEASNSSVSLRSYDDSRRQFSLFQLPPNNDSRDFDSMAAYELDERKSSSFSDFLLTPSPTQDVFLDNSFYDLHLNTISNASNSSSLPSSSSHSKSKKNPLKKDAVLPNINRIRRQDIDFFNRYTRELSEEAEVAAGSTMREQESLTMMTNSIYKQDVDLGYTFSNFNPSYTMSSIPGGAGRQIAEAEKVEVIQNLNLNQSKITESSEHGIDIGYLLSLASSTNATDTEAPPNVTSHHHQMPLRVDEDRKLAEILYEQDIDLGYILSASADSKEPYPPKVIEHTATKKKGEKEDSNDDVSSDLWAGIPFKIDNETGEYIRLPFEDILKDLIEESNELKDENAKTQEPQSPLDLDATIEDIANLFTRPSELFGGVQQEQQNAEATPYAHNNLYQSRHNANLCYETQHEQVYDYNNHRVNNFYPNHTESTEAHSSNHLYAANGGGTLHQEEHNDLGLHNDAYLDSILNSECFKMMSSSDNDSSSTTPHHGNPSDVVPNSAAGGGKNSDNKPPSGMSDSCNMTANFLDLSCGSAGSTLGSLGSESLPSDGEWGEGSNSSHDYHRSNFYGPYDYSSNPGTGSNFTRTRQMPVAQKKYHMFGKRYLQEELSNRTLDNSRINTMNVDSPISDLDGKENSTFDDFEDEMKNDGNLRNISKLIKKTVKTERDKFKSTDQNLVHHNHTYTMSHNHVSNPALDRDGSEYGDDHHSEEGHLTRDEKRARSLNVPIPVHDIINLPMDEFNECISKYELSENQLSLIRDIRRRGKNKVAAQNCRKRKLDTILSLESEVEEVRRRKEKLHNEKAYVAMEKKRIANKFAALHKLIFQSLKDDDGKPCSPSKFSLQQASDGSMYLLPRDNTSKQDPNCYMSLLMGEAASSSGVSASCRDSSRMKESNLSRTNADDTHSITQL